MPGYDFDTLEWFEGGIPASSERAFDEINWIEQGIPPSPSEVDEQIDLVCHETIEDIDFNPYASPAESVEADAEVTTQESTQGWGLIGVHIHVPSFQSKLQLLHDQGNVLERARLNKLFALICRKDNTFPSIVFNAETENSATRSTFLLTTGHAGVSTYNQEQDDYVITHASLVKSVYPDHDERAFVALAVPNAFLVASFVHLCQTDPNKSSELFGSYLDRSLHMWRPPVCVFDLSADAQTWVYDFILSETTPVFIRKSNTIEYFNVPSSEL